MLRSALTLSVCTGQPFRIERIRASRSRPGLLRQHLTAVRAAQEVSGGKVEGDELGSASLTFTPGRVRGGEYVFKVGSAGSTTLVFQTVLLPLLRAERPSRLVLEGGTHNPLAPTFDFLERAFLPLLARMGAQVKVELERPGYAPAGGGRFTAEVTPVARWSSLELVERGARRAIRPHAVVSDLPGSIAVRELDVLCEALGLVRSEHTPEQQDGFGPGNVVWVEYESEALTEVFSAFGERHLRAEAVADRVVTQVRRYQKSDAPSGEHLADQLLLPLALGAGGVLRALPLSRHAETNIDVVRRFLPSVRVDVEREAPTSSRVTVSV